MESNQRRKRQLASSAPITGPNNEDPLVVDKNVVDAVHGAILREVADASSVAEDDSHAALLKKLRSGVLAASRLGHRSCIALWGPSGNGKDHLLDLLAKSLRRQDNIVVIQLDGALLQNDEEAVRKIALEVHAFLNSSSAAKAKQRCAQLKNFTFEFATLMKMRSKRHQSDGHSDDSGDDDDVDPSNPAWDCDGGVRRGGAWLGDASTAGIAPLSLLKAPQTALSTLSSLQDALILLNKEGVSLVVCIHNATRFSVWCDRLMYILSGLMHDVDERTGGMSLIMTTTGPDMRQTEKRLSSRLTCEMCFVPNPSFSLHGCLTAAVGRAVAAFEREERILSEEESQCAATKANTAAPRRTAGRSEASSKAVYQSNESKLLVELRDRRRRTQDHVALAKRIHDVVSSPEWFSCHPYLVSRHDYCRHMCLPPSDVRRECLTALLEFPEVLHNASSSQRPQDSKQRSGRPRAKARTEPAPTATQRCDNDEKKSVEVIICAAGGGGCDLLSEGLLVRMGYASRELLFLLTFITMRADQGMLRSLSDHIVDISSLGGSASAKVFVPEHFQSAFELSRRLGLLRLERKDIVALCGPVHRYKEFLHDVFDDASLWSSTVGLTQLERTLLKQKV